MRPKNVTTFTGPRAACPYCQEAVTSTTLPPVTDDRGWAWIARSTGHAPDCEWVVTRALRVHQAAAHHA